ncbi:MAG: hypothetical protein IPG45_04520 [Deltaproteobacteria bacterium]|nr:hypothetical protein [Deltaproteobacteria bacterium]
MSEFEEPGMLEDGRLGLSLDWELGGPPGSDSGVVAERLLRVFLLEARLVLESMERAPLVVRLDAARRPKVITGGDWVQGMIGWSLALYSVWRAVDQGILEDDAEGLLSAAWHRLHREPLGLSEISVRMGDDPRWRSEMLGIWRDDVVVRTTARSLGRPRLDPTDAIHRVGASAIGACALAQATVLAEVQDLGAPEVYRALRRLAVRVARGSASSAALGTAVVPVLRRLVLVSAPKVFAPQPRSISTDGR